MSTHRSSGEYKNKYTRELRNILLVKFPPKRIEKKFKGLCGGLTGNFLVVHVFINSLRKFGKLRGWYYTKYSVKNRYAVLSERVELMRVDESIMRRLIARYHTVKTQTETLADVVNKQTTRYIYFTALSRRSLFVRNIKVVRDEYAAFSDVISNINVKTFVFERFNKRIINCVSLYDKNVMLFIQMLLTPNRS